MPSVFTLLWFEHPKGHFLVLQTGALRLIVGKRVFEPRRIIPCRVIGARVRASGFTSGQRSSRRSQGHIQHTLQLKSTDHVQIEYSTRMAQSNVGHPMFESEQLARPSAITSSSLKTPK